MQKLKSIFISLFCTYLFVAAAFSLYQYSITEIKSDLLLALTHLIGLAFFANLFISNIARTSALLPAWSGPILIAGTLTLYYSMTESNLSGLVLTIVILLGWMLYLFWYSKYDGIKSQALSLNKALPDFLLTTSSGQQFSNQDLIGHTSLLLFFRGNWCPLCMAQIKEVAAHYQVLTDMGVQVCLISPQPENNTRQLAQRFNVPFTYLLDKNLQTASSLGLMVSNGTPAGLELLGYDSDTVRPAVLITDKFGNLVYSDITDNYRVRPEPQAFIDKIQTLKLNS